MSTEAAAKNGLESALRTELIAHTGTGCVYVYDPSARTCLLYTSDKYFEFTVQLTGEEGKTYQDSYAITGGSYDANPASIEIKRCV